MTERPRGAPPGMTRVAPDLPQRVALASNSARAHLLAARRAGVLTQNAIHAVHSRSRKLLGPRERKAACRVPLSGRYSSNLTVAGTPNVHFAFMNQGL